MSLTGLGVRRTLAEQARRAACARHMGNAAALAVYFGPSTKGLPAWVRLGRAFTLRRRVRLSFQSADTKRRQSKRRRELMKTMLAVAALGAFALAFGPRRQAPGRVQGP